MPRYKITIEYDGTGLSGWQRQNDFYTVQAALEKAIFNFCQEEVQIQGAGRTDAGVHAFGQVAHFDLEKDWDEFKVMEAVNFHLREDSELPVAGQIVILKSEKVGDEFNARFDAKKRKYIYRIVSRRQHLTIERNRAWQVPEELDIDAMHNAAQIFVGEHDFTSFRASECQANSAIKSIDRISVKRIGHAIHMEVEAISFLHHQIRNFAGSLRLVGNGKWTKKDLQAALDAKNRTAAGPTAPACGLYFVSVEY